MSRGAGAKMMLNFEKEVLLLFKEGKDREAEEGTFGLYPQGSISLWAISKGGNFSGKWKSHSKFFQIRRARIREICDLPVKIMDIDARTELIQVLIPLGLWYVKEVLKQEVREVAGEPDKRQGLPGYDRWGKQWGSVYPRDQKLPILVPRVRDRQGAKRYG